MDILIVIVGFSCLLMGVYGAFVLPHGESLVRSVGRRTHATAVFHDAFASSRPIEAPRRTTTIPPRRQSGGLFSGILRPAVNVRRPDTPRPQRSLFGRGVIREMTAPSADALSEVDLLRAQVEELRSEIAALSGAAPARPERTRTRRHGLGLYTHLPRLLRRQVREIRSVRRPPMLRA